MVSGEEERKSLSRTPEKGKPDFSNLDDKRLLEYREVINDMIWAFSDFPEEKAILERVWKRLSEACAERDYTEPCLKPKRLPKTFKRSRLKINT